MLGSAALDTAVGLILVYLVLSFMCSAINELLEAWMKHRAVDLERGVRALLNDDQGTEFAKRLYEHPFVYGLFKGKYDPQNPGNLPSYIPSTNFALALMDIIVPATATTPSGAAGAEAGPIVLPGVPAGLPGAPPAGAVGGAPGAVSSLRTAVAAISGNDHLRTALLAIIDSAGNDAVRVRVGIEQWFDSAMDRVSGWYKRRKQGIILAIGLAVAVALNVNTIRLAETLWTNQALRESIVRMADTYVDEAHATAQGTPPGQQFAQNLTTLQSFALPIGWGPTLEQLAASGDHNRASFLSRFRLLHQQFWLLFWQGLTLDAVAGWLLTACAISLGAPFWFDLLNRFTVIRSTIKPHEKSPEEPAKG